LALSLQAPVMPVLPPSASTASSSSSAPSVHFPIDSSVAAASGSQEPSYPSTLPSPSSSLVVHGANASSPGVVSIDLLSNPVKIERGVGFGGGVGGDIVSHADPVSIKEEKEIGKEERNSNSSSSSIRGSASKDSCGNGNGSGSSSNSRALVGGSEALYPAITMKLEDMPVSACRVVNPFSRYCNPHVLSVTVSHHTMQFTNSSNFVLAGWD
jgi:hypothetical protein